MSLPLSKRRTVADATGDHSDLAALSELGRRLGKYELERQLGAGGMGIVYGAFDPDLERYVAIKLLHDAADDASCARLLREGRAMARLSHPNVVTVHDVGSIGGRDFVAMELIDGGSVADWLRALPRSVDEVLDVFVAAGHGLAAAHAEGVVHRDFKPHNVLRSAKGRVLVTDFGIARTADEPLELAPGDAIDAGDDGEAAASRPLVTKTGALVGTPAYMAPEQWQRGALGPATDQFAFCVALWEALAGARPFTGGSHAELRAAIATGPRVVDAAKIPRRLRALLRRGLDPDPARRWPSIDALLRAIARARRPSPIVIGAVAGAIVAAIVIAEIVIGRGLGRGRTDDDPRELARAAITVPLAHDAVVDAITAVGEAQFTVPRAIVAQIIADGTTLFAHDAAVIKTLQADESIGYKLFAIKPHSIWAAFKLQNGDLVTSVDGIGLVSPDKLVEIYRDVLGRDHVVVDFQRKREAHRLAISIQ